MIAVTGEGTDQAGGSQPCRQVTGIVASGRQCLRYPSYAGLAGRAVVGCGAGSEGVANSLAGRAQEAIPLFKQTLAAWERLLGPDHCDTLASRNNLAEAYVEAHQYTEAIPLLEQALVGMERVLGPDHPYTFTARNNLAAAHREGTGRA